MKKLIIVDVEADGPVPGIYSMVSFGAVIVEEGLQKTFYGKVKPISDKFIPEALAVSGHSREEHLLFNNVIDVMKAFTDWIKLHSPDGAVFLSDNNGFDWSFINYYFHAFYGSNPFGFSSRRIGDLYCGLVNDFYANRNWKKFRKTKHTHNPVDDAKGNAEAFLYFTKQNNMKIK